ncbi:MAG: alpha/beta hydrolase [Planctomycetes bacterium]|nr:alpha/beta hydrolase [Planctomycetota bacterium]
MGLDRPQPVDLLIALHGHGSDRWQYVRDARGEYRGVRDVAARRGMVFISPDYRAPASWTGPKGESDLRRILDRLERQYRVRRVYLAGGSMGGTGALIFACLHPDRIDGVLSENGPANVVEYAGFGDAIALVRAARRTRRSQRPSHSQNTPRRARRPIPRRVTRRTEACSRGSRLPKRNTGCDWPGVGRSARFPRRRPPARDRCRAEAERTGRPGRHPRTRDRRSELDSVRLPPGSKPGGRATPRSTRHGHRQSRCDRVRRRRLDHGVPGRPGRRRCRPSRFPGTRTARRRIEPSRGPTRFPRPFRLCHGRTSCDCGTPP